MPSYDCFVNHKSWLSIKFTPTNDFGLSLYKTIDCRLPHQGNPCFDDIVAWPFEMQTLSRNTFQCAPVYIWMAVYNHWTGLHGGLDYWNRFLKSFLDIYINSLYWNAEYLVLTSPSIHSNNAIWPLQTSQLCSATSATIIAPVSHSNALACVTTI